MPTIPAIRIRAIHDTQINHAGDYVLYWMTAFRRGQYNFSLQHAAFWAKKLGKPLVILEALRCDYRWASDRLHKFIIEGMIDNARHFAAKPVTYYPYLEPTVGAGKGLLRELSQRACVVISDDFPCFFIPRMIQAAAIQIGVRFELVDSNGLLPMRATDKVFARAFDFRRFLQKQLLPHLADAPQRDPLARVELPILPELPAHMATRWPMAQLLESFNLAKDLPQLPIDHSITSGIALGGSSRAQHALKTFLQSRLSIYGTERNQPEQEATSGLSPYLHFGHISVHEIFEKVIQQAEWTPDRVASKADGSSSGWWGVAAEVESFLDELITWRELGYNMCSLRDDYDTYESLPDWAQRTLAEHAVDRRQYCYSLEEFERATTHDKLWNAAQRQLVFEGRMHNYLRMLWGKKILEWSATPRDALRVMIELNNKYAIDGRNPNSYSGIFWVLGRYDRAWGPERPIFGTIRFMSSDNTARKVKVKKYLEKYAPVDSQRRLAFD